MCYILTKLFLENKKNSAELASKVDTDEEGIYELEDKSKEIIKKGRGYSSVVELLPRRNQECNTRGICPEVIRNATQVETHKELPKIVCREPRKV